MLEGLIKDFLLELQAIGRSTKTVEAYKYHLEKFARFCEESGCDFRTINGKESRAFRNWLVELGLKPASINAIIAATKSFYDFLAEEEVVKGNPIISRRLRVAEERGLPGFLTKAEEKKVLAHLANLPCHIGLAFKTMLVSGLRVSEAAALKTEDVLVQQGGVFLAVKHGKGDKGRLVPVTNRDVARELLTFAQKKAQGDKLFGVTDSTLKWYAQAIRQATGVDFHSHRCRHTLATRLLAQGVPIDVVQMVLGHQNINTTRRYAKTAPEKLCRLAAKVE
ncbi:MAG TPA: tyrosine-type recombinase/integrase [Oscillospiraceae bacterium]|nr:tyrosine-type recombinase/integrase [Oscillospiraceae bacterium]